MKELPNNVRIRTTCDRELQRQIKSQIAPLLLHGNRRLVSGFIGGDRTYECYNGYGTYLISIYANGDIAELKYQAHEIPRYTDMYGRGVLWSPREKINRSRWPRISVKLEGELDDEHGVIHAAYHDRRTRKLLYTLHLPLVWKYQWCIDSMWLVPNSVVIDGGLTDAPLQEATEHLLNRMSYAIT